MAKNNTVLALDAGGTNFVFNAVTNGVIVDKTFSLPAKSDSLQHLLEKIIHGFREINKQTGNLAVAISFCFPSPADFENGIIGDLENLPFFRGGVALKKMLENEFRIPVFINNDGDLFTLGEAIKGVLPEINAKLKASKIRKQYRNLLGVTLGTGFGGGIVHQGELFLGDNSAGAEINRMVNPSNWNMSVEETLSIRGIKRLFAEESGLEFKEVPDPYTIFTIGIGKAEGNREAAIRAWERFGKVLGDALANALTLVDGLAVIGGGLSGAHPLFLPKAVEMLNRKFDRPGGGKVPRMEISAYNLETEDGLQGFLNQQEILIKVPFSDDMTPYYPEKKTGVSTTKLGTSRAVALGAYAYAANQIGF
ncbi:MAG: ROK family protein [bacterium]|jgi:glucokinase